MDQFAYGKRTGWSILVNRGRVFSHDNRESRVQVPIDVTRGFESLALHNGEDVPVQEPYMFVSVAGIKWPINCYSQGPALSVTNLG